MVSAGCSGDSGRVAVTGHWIGTVDLSGESWVVDMTITQTGPSVSGSGTRSTYPNVPYAITGDLVGDSVFLRFAPPEDIDLRFGLRTERDRLVGVMWFGTNREGYTTPVTFNRQ